MSDDTLAGLRQEIAQVDREIFRLLGRRMELAHRVGEVKIAAGRPLRDYRVETEVLARAEGLAREMNLPPSLGRDLVAVLLQAAVKVQEDLRERSHRGRLRKIAVVGGAGKMGRWLVQFLDGQGHDVTVVDPAGSVPGFRHAERLELAPAETLVYLVSVPMSAAPALYRELLARPGDALLVDTLSVKHGLLDLIREGVARGRRVASIHPMFGPSVFLLSGRVLAVCDCGCPDGTDEARHLFAGTSLTVTDVGLEEHDELMTIVLGLSHVANILFFHALRRSGHPYRELERFASTTFSKQIASAAEVAAENPYLYYEIQKSNPNTPAMFDLLLASARELKEASVAGTPERFVEIMRQGRVYLERRET